MKNMSLPHLLLGWSLRLKKLTSALTVKLKKKLAANLQRVQELLVLLG